MYRFAGDWPMWEMHPGGAEVVLCTAGSMTLHQEYPDGRRESLTLGWGEYAINPPGVWHTADISGEATGVFITAGAGTQHRPR
jgi:quercetin dioxygenase-like cupin family protein